MKSLHRKQAGPARQQGVAALGIALVVLLIATLVTIGVVQVGLGEQRAMGSQLRNGEARAVAEAAMDRGIMYLSQNSNYVTSTGTDGWMAAGAVKWTSCSSSTITIPCGDGKVNLFDSNWTAYSNVSIPTTTAAGATTAGMKAHYVARVAVAGSTTPGSSVYYIIGEGTTTDLGGHALLRKAVTFVPFIMHRPDAPLIAAGTIGLTGTISVVANPNGGGTGVPLSSWSGSNTTESGSVQTCHIQEFLSTDSGQTTATDSHGNSITLCPQCTCPNDTSMQISSRNTEGIDVLDVDSNVGANPDATNFPSDVFQYVFGVPASQYQSIKDKAQLITDCSSLGPSSSGLIWVTVNCDIPSNTTIGSLDHPVIVVVDNSTFKMNANSSYFGIIFAFKHDGGSINVTLNGGPTLYGSVISNGNIDLGNGTYTARYDSTVLDNLSLGGPGRNSSIAEVPGSWKDF